jgi:hypothetical protein
VPTNEEPFLTWPTRPVQIVSPNTMSELHPDSNEQTFAAFRYLGVLLVALIALIGSFGAWRRSLEALDVGHSISFAVAIVADVLLIFVLLGNEAVWTAVTKSEGIPERAVASSPSSASA